VPQINFSFAVQLASKIKAINIGQQTIAPVYGVLSQKDGKMTLEAPKNSSASGSEVQRKRILWGSPKVEEFVRKLGEVSDFVFLKYLYNYGYFKGLKMLFS
jgi:hypothetical protein